MKKVGCLLMCIVLAVSLAGCKEVLPPDTSQFPYEMGKKALEITDLYLAFQKTADDAENEVYAIYKQLLNWKDGVEELQNDFCIRRYTGQCQLWLLMASNDKGDRAELMGARDRLAEALRSP